jgi:hypothetical protein
MNNILIFGLVVAALSAPAHATKMSSRKWKSIIRTELPPAVCNKDSYFLNCFEATLESCQASVQRNFDKCAKRVSMPKQINVLTEGPAWANKLGSCAGSATEADLPKMKPQPQRCADVRNWL